MSLPIAAKLTSNDDIIPGHPSHEDIPYVPSAPSASSSQTSSQLSTPAKAAIITAGIIVFLVLLLVTLGYTYLRRKRHERAVKQAIDEVERGTELKEASAYESKENMVLESRVEIVVHGEGQGSQRDDWERQSQWDTGTDEDENDGDLGEWGRGRMWERGRNGMSLPRRGI
jgi:flagellar biosynthesis/type III secretory pathway M-ring protein FliF/YscJ